MSLPLTRQRVLKTAVRLADKDGLESLSMRKLARSLGVEAMSLYNHVANKGDLVDAMFELVMTEVELPPGSERWDSAVRSYAIAMHDALIRHPWAGNLAVGLGGGGVPRPSRLAQMDWLLRRLREGGFSSELTYHGYHVLDAHILGFTLWELGHDAAAREMGPGFELERFVADLLDSLRAQGYADLADHAEQHLSTEFDSVSAFEYGLDLILDGLRRAKRRR